MTFSFPMSEATPNNRPFPAVTIPPARYQHSACSRIHSSNDCGAVAAPLFFPKKERIFVTLLSMPECVTRSFFFRREHTLRACHLFGRFVLFKKKT